MTIKKSLIYNAFWYGLSGISLLIAEIRVQLYCYLNDADLDQFSNSSWKYIPYKPLINIPDINGYVIGAILVVIIAFGIYLGCKGGENNPVSSGFCSRLKMPRPVIYAFVAFIIAAIITRLLYSPHPAYLSGTIYYFLISFTPIALLALCCMNLNQLIKINKYGVDENHYFSEYQGKYFNVEKLLDEHPEAIHDLKYIPVDYLEQHPEVVPTLRYGDIPYKYLCNHPEIRKKKLF